MRFRIASVLFYIVCCFAILFGIMYLSSPTILPYHERFIGKTHQQLDPSTGRLFVFFMKVNGMAFLSLGISMVLLLRGPLKNGEFWTWLTVMVLGGLNLITLFVLTLKVGYFTPWWAIGLITIIFLVAMHLLKTPNERRQKL